MDKLKELSAKLDGKVKSQNLVNVNVGETSFRKLVIKNYRQYKIKIDEYGDLFAIGVNVNSCISFSINSPDRIFLYTKPKRFPGVPYVIYVADENIDFSANRDFEILLLSMGAFLRKIEFSAGEAVFLYGNYVYFYLTGQRDLESILAGIIDLINANKGVFREEIKRNISSKGIPENLKSLIPLLKKYSISDDADRTQLAEEMSEGEKIKLIQSVQPLVGEINSYLNSFKYAPLSEEAVLIGALAELVSELK